MSGAAHPPVEDDWWVPLDDLFGTPAMWRQYAKSMNFGRPGGMASIKHTNDPMTAVKTGPDAFKK